MKRPWKAVELTTLALLTAACGDSASRGDSASGTSTSTSRGTESTDATTPTEGSGSVSDSMSQSTGDGGSASDSQATATATATTSAASVSASASDGTTSDGSATAGTTDDVSATTVDTTQPGSSSDSTSAAGTGTVSTGTTGSDSDTGTTSGGSDTDGDPLCEPPSAEVFSFLWVANSDQGTISKIDADTMTELARYYTDPSQSAGVFPARTSVSIDGRFVVVSNRLGRGTTKIAANPDDCIDYNKNGVIDTSMNKNDIRPYLEDECILWTTQVIPHPFATGAGPRATAFGLPEYNPKTCKYENEKVWVGYLAGSGVAEMARLDSYTGEIEDTVQLPNWPIVIDPPHGFGPYGAAIGPDGAVWTTGVWTRVVYRIDPDTLEVQRYESPHADTHYGMAVSAGGRVWFANVDGLGGHAGISYFEPQDQSWGVVNGTSIHTTNGITTDSEGRVWAATLGGTYGCGLMQIDAKTLSLTAFHKFAKCDYPTGVGIDGKGMVWMVDYHSYLWQLDPNTLEKKLLAVPNKHYTYSDFTGRGLGGIGP